MLQGVKNHSDKQATGLLDIISSLPKRLPAKGKRRGADVGPQQVQVTATKPDKLDVTPGTDMVEENQLLHTVLTSHVHRGMHSHMSMGVHTRTNNSNNKVK